MSAAAPPAPPSRRPPTPHDTLPSFALALAMHALLFGSMAWVVRWKTQDPAPVVAELWVSTPQPVVATPAPPPPPPPPPPPKVEEPEPPRNADIVTKDEKKPPPKVEPPKVEKKDPPKKVEPKKVEPKKDVLADLLKKEEEKSRQERDAIRKAEADRMEKLMSEAATGPTPQPGSGRANADYIARLTALIKSRIVYNVPDGTPASVYAEVQVDLLPSGEVVAVKVLKESGLPGYDAAVERAIRRTDPFPRKPDGTIDRTITIRFRPVEPTN